MRSERKSIIAKKNQQKIENIAWTTDKVNQYLHNLENGILVDDMKSPFKDAEIGFRKAKSHLPFKMTKDEEAEFIKCAQDPLYFANTYAHAMTDEGVQKIQLRDYQEDIIKSFADNRFNILLASRQIGKCGTFDTDIYINNKQSITFYELYFQILKRFRKLTFLEKCKLLLYKLYHKLNLKGK